MSVKPKVLELGSSSHFDPLCRGFITWLTGVPYLCSTAATDSRFFGGEEERGNHQIGDRRRGREGRERARFSFFAHEPDSEADTKMKAAEAPPPLLISFMSSLTINMEFMFRLGTVAQEVNVWANLAVPKLMHKLMLWVASSTDMGWKLFLHHL